MNNHESEKGIQEIENYWMKDQELVQNLLDNGAQSVIESAPEQELPVDKPCACIDERVGGFKIGVAGSGILHTQEDALKILKSAGVTSISSHQDCGAANLAFEKLSEEQKTEYGSANNYAIEWTKSMADKLGIPYDGHKSVDTPGQHIARAIYYDATGEFTADRPDLPKGFTISRKFLEKSDAQDSLALSMKIAFGDHGFKNKFDLENPLVIVPIASADDMESVKQEIYDTLSKDPVLAEKIHLDNGVVTVESRAQQVA